jgi:5-methylcytosine-specific restriction endonuclease McrA
VTTERLCDDCGTVYYSSQRRSRYCSYSCNKRVEAIATEARKRGRAAHPIGRFSIFSRDGWVCYLCGTPTIRTVGERGPLAPSLDHVVPLSDPECPGHVVSNVRTTHMTCNKRKADRDFVEGDQEWYLWMLYGPDGVCVGRTVNVSWGLR